jgi:hypothetical protein
MRVGRIVVLLAATAGIFSAAPASAQFFIKPANLAGPRVTGGEPDMIGGALPGANAEEQRAALVWSLRAALNVAALQCQFEPTLLALGNYTAILRDHRVELKKSYDTLEKYFIRVTKNKKAGQDELDRFGTRVYSSFSTVGGQLSFCQTAGSIGHEALFTKPGSLADLASERMRELRNSLAPWGEQAFPRGYNRPVANVHLPVFFREDCWSDKGKWLIKKCGPLPTDG